MITLNNIDVFYGKSQALYDISLNVKPGEVVALIGANGAGKTTVLKTISGLLSPSKGEITFKNESLCGIPSDKIAKKGIAHVPERGGMFTTMTVKENLELGSVAGRKNVNLKERFDKVYGIFPILKDRYNQLSGLLSGGERQMLAIARAMMSNPELYLLDEPTLGLSPLMVTEIGNTVKNISSLGGTILLVEQAALMALESSHRGYVIEIGKIIREGLSADLEQDEEIKKSYLGS